MALRLNHKRTGGFVAAFLFAFINQKNRTRMTGSLKVERWKGSPKQTKPDYKTVSSRVGWQSPCHRDRRSLPNRQLRCLCRTDFGSPILRQSASFSAYIRVNRLTRDPVFCQSFEVRAGFVIGCSCEGYIAGLNSKPGQHGVQRAFPGCKYPLHAWALWTSCGGIACNNSESGYSINLSNS
ncbi:MAG: hypothetical protein BWX75_00946 [Candidatus Cloacimonetes bacterium ADurb.Bin088]|nr:MAG: hypothetical protein BWX75_00946 [Candidatus Cloacimonetes bacterium ADurb.Bin088]